MLPRRKGKIARIISFFSTSFGSSGRHPMPSKDDFLTISNSTILHFTNEQPEFLISDVGQETQRMCQYFRRWVVLDAAPTTTKKSISTEYFSMRSNITRPSPRFSMTGKGLKYAKRTHDMSLSQISPSFAPQMFCRQNCNLLYPLFQHN